MVTHQLPPVAKHVLECLRDGKSPWDERGPWAANAITRAFRQQEKLGRIMPGVIFRNSGSELVKTGQHFGQTAATLTEAGREALAFAR